jgi:indolepyruvate ferredoxin oxidoreductase beta subunit
MPDHAAVTNIVFAGLGGLGVLRASDILAEAAFLAGFDVKKSEIHGMSQRGGSVRSDVRFGAEVLSPMITAGEADCLVVLHPSQVEVVRHCLREGGTLLTTDAFFPPEAGPKALDADASTPLTARNFNVAMLGMLSVSLPFEDAAWHEAIRAHLPEKARAENLEVFAHGRTLRGKTAAAAGHGEARA